MASKYLNDTGLSYFYNKLKTVFQAKEDGKGLSTNDYTTAEKQKLSGISSGAEVNQNAFSNVKVGATTIAADGKTDTLELTAGSNITLTPDATNDKVTVEATVPTKTSDLTNDSGFITSSDIPEGAAATTTTPLMDGTAAVGTELAFARGDHVHPSDTSRVPTTRTVNGHALSADVTVTASDVGLGNVDNTADANKSVNSAAQLTTARTINGVTFNGTTNILFSGVCSSLASATTKVASIPLYTLTDWSTIIVVFANDGSGDGNVFLSINDGDAKQVFYSDNGTTSYVKNYLIKKNTPYLFTYVASDNRWWMGGYDHVYTAMTQAQATAGTNTSGYLISPSVLKTTIANAVGEITSIEFEIVQTLPATGEAGVIYLLSNGGSSGNSYDEYIYVSDSFEKIGTTDIDLSNYMQFDDITPITTSEIDTMFV